MMFHLLRQRIILVLCSLIIAALPAALFAQSATAIPQHQLIQPEELVKILQSGKARPLVLNVGPHMIYTQSHIRGAEYIGPASNPDDLGRLRARVEPLPRSSFIVVYCGCCPWTRCPNINPAITELRRIGFKNAKALYIANNFGSDWAEKGYPVDSGNR